ncbi:hypothetical protein CLOM_g3091 [Closterium sp. NIES-68]|nr:hypothetical protein CLOM_g3091 [Closterium sp. NIES-68]
MTGTGMSEADRRTSTETTSPLTDTTSPLTDTTSLATHKQQQQLKAQQEKQQEVQQQSKQQQQQPHPPSSPSTPAPPSPSTTTSPPPSPSLPPPVTFLDLLAAARLPRLIVDCSIFVFGLYLLSPILHTLTQSISSDTVTSCTTLLFLLHLFFHDYNYSTAATLSFSGNLSLMSAIYASVLLASRLSTTAQVYAFMWLALSVFSLLPSLLHHWRRANPQTHRVLVWGMKAVSLAILMAWSKVMALVVVVAAASVTYVFPLLFVYMHKEKQFIKGPWDEAQPGTSSN